jgi:hypothetical protein
MNTTKAGMSVGQLKVLKTDVRERFPATAFIFSADRLRFGKLIEDMENNFLQGNNKYPSTLASAHHLHASWRHDARLGLKDVAGGEKSFVDYNNEKKGKERKNKAEVECHRCRQKGHYANKCKNKRAH